MKRARLLKTLRQIAAANGVQMEEIEGGRHTKIRFGGRHVTVVPRHNEISEQTARSIIRDAENWKEA